MKLKKSLFLSLTLTALCLTCCACTSAEAPTEDTDTSEFKTDAYTLTLPQGLTAQEASAGSAAFLLDGKEVGGIAVIPYENADQLTLDALSSNDSAEAKALNDTLNDFLKQVTSVQNPDRMFSDSIYSSFTLSIVNEDGTNSMLHEFYPDGDRFFDVYFDEVSDVTADQKDAVWSSFTLNP